MRTTYHILTTAFLAAFLVLAGIGGCSSCAGSTFDGSRTANEDGFYLSFTMLDRTEEATLPASGGDMLLIELVLEAGTVDVSITGPDGASAYTGTEQTGGSFVVVLPSAGDYTLSVTGRKAAGTVSFARVQ